MDFQWSRCEAVLDDARRLQGAAAPDLDDLDRVLTDGYACVLRTEGERSRLRAQLEERAAAIGDSPDRGALVEMRELAQGIARADSEIEEFRSALGRLAARAQTLRKAS
ncbi:MAG TPA: hypothetical protein VN449_05350 [Gaiellaceae bacterium]|nr:hypothetical protein [Gaiellaceae bacterium]